MTPSETNYKTMALKRELAEMLQVLELCPEDKREACFISTLDYLIEQLVNMKYGRYFQKNY